MAGVNKVILVGNLGKDPEVRTVASGQQVAKFPLATSETYTNKEGQKIENTEWHNVVAWRGLATLTERYLKKGNKVYIEGKIRTRQYEDKDGVKKYVTEIEANEMVLLDRPQGGAGAGAGNTGTGNYTSSGNDTNTSSNTDNSSSGNYNPPASSDPGPEISDDLPF